jgi:hypothetical protein
MIHLFGTVWPAVGSLLFTFLHPFQPPGCTFHCLGKNLGTEWSILVGVSPLLSNGMESCHYVQHCLRCLANPREGKTAGFFILPACHDTPLSIASQIAQELKIT